MAWQGALAILQVASNYLVKCGARCGSLVKNTTYFDRNFCKVCIFFILLAAIRGLGKERGVPTMGLPAITTQASAKFERIQYYRISSDMSLELCWAFRFETAVRLQHWRKQSRNNWKEQWKVGHAKRQGIKSKDKKRTKAGQKQSDPNRSQFDLRNRKSSHSKTWAQSVG